MEKTAILVVDMLNDFVTGALACERAKRIIPPLAKLLEQARSKGLPVIYSCDSHVPGIDHELKLWGNHAILGTHGAEIIHELEPEESDYIVPKRRYSGFFDTGLHLLLIELGIDTLIIVGLQAHLCVRHTAADAYQWGYNILVPSDGIEAFSEAEYLNGLEYLHTFYGAEITDVASLIAKF
jgi:nicotinamidase-related amidase